ncbi:hypothetical protein ANN_10887 [Periplaneta americana]|uniref:Uncharacterized protein n=1 Tax=Periplaneta americana TaxID=6978 RepID=A0ABQ8T470_PERAM|nr:hypothetical protein ANN_10887 [Periplaneta americana]
MHVSAFPQSQWRMVLAQRLLNQTRVRIAAAVQIQRAWRSHKASAWYRKLRSGIVVFQAHIRGYLVRRKLKEAKQAREEEARHQASSVDAHSAQSTDEAFLSKESSQEELDERLGLEVEDRELQDSEESSGIQEDSESEPILPEPGPVDTVSRSPRSSAQLSASSTDKRVLRLQQTKFDNTISREKWNSLHLNPQLIPDLPQKSSGAAFRLATGHDCLAKYLHRIGIYQSPNCPLCNSNQEMDSEHLKICASLADHDNIFEKY